MNWLNLFLFLHSVSLFTRFTLRHETRRQVSVIRFDSVSFLDSAFTSVPTWCSVQLVSRSIRSAIDWTRFPLYINSSPLRLLPPFRRYSFYSDPVSNFHTFPFPYLTVHAYHYWFRHYVTVDTLRPVTIGAAVLDTNLSSTPLIVIRIRTTFTAVLPVSPDRSPFPFDSSPVGSHSKDIVYTSTPLPKTESINWPFNKTDAVSPISSDYSVLAPLDAAIRHEGLLAFYRHIANNGFPSEFSIPFRINEERKESNRKSISAPFLNKIKRKLFEDSLDNISDSPLEESVSKPLALPKGARIIKKSVPKSPSPVKRLTKRQWKNLKTKRNRQTKELIAINNGTVSQSTIHYLETRKRYNDNRAKQNFRLGLRLAKRASQVDKSVDKSTIETSAQLKNVTDFNYLRRFSRKEIDSALTASATALRYEEYIRRQKKGDRETKVTVSPSEAKRRLHTNFFKHWSTPFLYSIRFLNQFYLYFESILL